MIFLMLFMMTSLYSKLLSVLPLAGVSRIHGPYRDMPLNGCFSGAGK
jgi:hypothetical protein